jgi:hypothetical protein
MFSKISVNYRLVELEREEDFMDLLPPYTLPNQEPGNQPTKGIGNEWQSHNDIGGQEQRSTKVKVVIPSPTLVTGNLPGPMKVIWILFLRVLRLCHAQKGASPNQSRTSVSPQPCGWCPGFAQPQDPSLACLQWFMNSCWSEFLWCKTHKLLNLSPCPALWFLSIPETAWLLQVCCIRINLIELKFWLEFNCGPDHWASPGRWIFLGPSFPHSLGLCWLHVCSLCSCPISKAYPPLPIKQSCSVPHTSPHTSSPYTLSCETDT